MSCDNHLTIHLSSVQSLGIVVSYSLPLCATVRGERKGGREGGRKGGREGKGRMEEGRNREKEGGKGRGRERERGRQCKK